jgi:hypothetical protein
MEEKKMIWYFLLGALSSGLGATCLVLGLNLLPVTVVIVSRDPKAPEQP